MVKLSFFFLFEIAIAATYGSTIPGGGGGHQLVANGKVEEQFRRIHKR